MGLEGVELVMFFEDEFGLSLPDSAVAQMITVGETAKCITQALAEQHFLRGVCATAHSFYALRKHLVRDFGVAPELIKLDTRIGILIPSARGRDRPKIADACGLRWEASCFFRKRIPPADMPLGEFIKDRCKTRWLRLDGTIDEEIVFQRIRQIVSDEMRVPLESIGHETRYAEDLGI